MIELLDPNSLNAKQNTESGPIFVKKKTTQPMTYFGPILPSPNKNPSPVAADVLKESLRLTTLPADAKISGATNPFSFMCESND